MHSVFFFFSSRRRHTRWTGDWSSDVCSSDLLRAGVVPAEAGDHFIEHQQGAMLVTEGPETGQKSLGGLDRGRGFEYAAGDEIGRASCRERGKISVVAVSLKREIDFVCCT